MYSAAPREPVQAPANLPIFPAFAPQFPGLLNRMES